MNFTIFTANCVGNNKNCRYPNKNNVSCEDDLHNVTGYDHVCAEFIDNYRANEKFVKSDVVVMDCDNDYSDNPQDWITTSVICDTLIDVAFAIAPSRNNMKPKNGKSARPRFHVYFPIKPIYDASIYADLKLAIYTMFTFFDEKALDSARFIYGSNTGKVIWHEGSMLIDDIVGVQEPKRTIPEGSRNSTMSRFAGRVIKRYGITDQSYQIFLEEAEKCVPPLDDSELNTIWNSAVKFGKKLQEQEGYVAPDKYNMEFEADTDDTTSDIQWDDPIPLEDELLPTFPVDALTPTLKNYVTAIAESTQTPVDMAAVAVLTAVSAAMRNLYKVVGKEDWLEPTNIYALTIAEPSERKSAVITFATKPISSYVTEYNIKHKVDFEMSKAKKQRLENKKNSLLSQSKKKNDENNGADFNDNLQSVIEDLVNFKEEKPLKVFVDDTTPEKLVELLAENNGAMSVISSEGGIFDVLSGTYSNKVNIDVFLKAYTGDRITVERIMRNSISLDEPCLTILLSVQPVVIGDLMKNDKFRHRGLTARFLYTEPKSYIGERNFNSKPVPEGVYEQYKELIYNILSEKRYAKAMPIHLTADARIILNTFYDWVEQKLVGEYSMYGDWIGKLVGNTLRIAGILARTLVLKKDINDAIFETDPPVVIDASVMKNAIEIGKYFLTHAVYAYSTMGVQSELKNALKVLNKIHEKNIDRLDKRTIMRTCRWVKSATNAQKVLDTLEDYGFVRIPSVNYIDKSKQGRPKNAEYLVNPKAFNGFHN